MAKFGAASVVLVALTYGPVVYFFGSTLYANQYVAAVSFTGMAAAAWFALHIMTSSERVDSKNKAIFITGADTGFGHMLAQRLDAEGYTVFAGCLDLDGLGARELSKSCSERLHLVSLDVTNEDHAIKALKHVEEHLGNNDLWCLVNNAGISIMGEVELCPVTYYQKLMEVNTFGAVRSTQTFLPLIRKCKGRIIFTASLSGRYSLPAYTAYSMSKCALVSLADGLRREMTRFGVNVSIIEPTIYKTAITTSEDLMTASRKCWAQSPEPVQNDYGQKDHIDKLLNFVQNIVTTRGRDNPGEVVDCLFDAVTTVEPKIRYIPHWKVAVRGRLLESLPCFLQDKMINASFALKNT